ncbi:hypothetical protein EJ04DRAFT_286383 [Polyplosphaeria fusca]|uniref:Uncharacterized protein n=1 Tax=Polyplosphaeria fusca TaxID=682080 RepID=A0A9P4R9H8_9PLEO|nr:hypothetical protein EJ04DRAFT_286383 [Polyplosphaeria fusca]
MAPVHSVLHGPPPPDNAKTNIFYRLRPSATTEWTEEDDAYLYELAGGTRDDAHNMIQEPDINSDGAFSSDGLYSDDDFPTDSSTPQENCQQQEPTTIEGHEPSGNQPTDEVIPDSAPVTNVSHLSPSLEEFAAQVKSGRADLQLAIESIKWDVVDLRSEVAGIKKNVDETPIVQAPAAPADGSKPDPEPQTSSARGNPRGGAWINVTKHSGGELTFLRKGEESNCAEVAREVAKFLREYGAATANNNPPELDRMSTRLTDILYFVRQFDRLWLSASIPVTMRLAGHVLLEQSKALLEDTKASWLVQEQVFNIHDKLMALGSAARIAAQVDSAVSILADKKKTAPAFNLLSELDKLLEALCSWFKTVEEGKGNYHKSRFLRRFDRLLACTSNILPLSRDDDHTI